MLVDRFPLRHPRLLAVAVVTWTAVSWGGRIGLLTDAEGAQYATWLRVGGSIVVGIAMAWSAWRRPTWHRVVAIAFSGWTVVVWARALVTAWIDPPSLPFALVHTVLALVWFLLAWWAWATRSMRTDTATPTSLGASQHTT